ncbi:MAG: hypothetical protein HY390_03930 [Deltaproteobacteria bacterium]|nr:hypothetical protein [Deltaproteobacteria bacterium]
MFRIKNKNYFLGNLWPEVFLFLFLLFLSTFCAPPDQKLNRGSATSSESPSSDQVGVSENKIVEEAPSGSSPANETGCLNCLGEISGNGDGDGDGDGDDDGYGIDVPPPPPPDTSPILVRLEACAGNVIRNYELLLVATVSRDVVQALTGDTPLIANIIAKVDVQFQNGAILKDVVIRNFYKQTSPSPYYNYSDYVGTYTHENTSSNNWGVPVQSGSIRVTHVRFYFNGSATSSGDKYEDLAARGHITLNIPNPAQAYLQERCTNYNSSNHQYVRDATHWRPQPPFDFPIVRVPNDPFVLSGTMDLARSVTVGSGLVSGTPSVSSSGATSSPLASGSSTSSGSSSSGSGTYQSPYANCRNISPQLLRFDYSHKPYPTQVYTPCPSPMITALSNIPNVCQVYCGLFSAEPRRVDVYVIPGQVSWQQITQALGQVNYSAINKQNCVLTTGPAQCTSVP